MHKTIKLTWTVLIQMHIILCYFSNWLITNKEITNNSNLLHCQNCFILVVSGLTWSIFIKKVARQTKSNDSSNQLSKHWQNDNWLIEIIWQKRTDVLAFCSAEACWWIARCASDRICATRCSVSVESCLLLGSFAIHSKHIIILHFTGYWVTGLSLITHNQS